MSNLEKQGPMQLTKDQLEIVCTPVDEKLLVLAGPGTGKTHTLVHRIVHLVQEQGLVPYSDLLILSFSRAAIGEIKQRISTMVSSGFSDDLRFLNIRTFDSFSTKLMISLEESVELVGKSYDERIQLATEILTSDNPGAVSILKQFRHVIVDEIQDLVGVRAKLVQQVLRVSNGGYSLFGDPAQGIFDYLVEQSGIGPKSIEFLSSIREISGNNLKEKVLDENFRVQSPSVSIASNVRSLITDSRDGGHEIYEKTKWIIDSLEGIGSIDSAENLKLFSGEKRTTLLCRTNSDVLFATSNFIQQGISCVAPPHKYEQGIPAWVGRVLGEYKHDKISKPGFEDEWLKMVGADKNWMVDASWKIIKSIEDGDRGHIDLSVLVSRLRKGINWAFDSESYMHNGGILITTIHQAKGREYDNVIIMPPEQSNLKFAGINGQEEAKILYVAATRAREKMFRLERRGVPILSDFRFPSGIERLTGQGRSGRHLFEILPDDVDQASYVHELLFQNANLVKKVQNLIWQYILPGTQLHLVPQNIKGNMKIVLTWKNPSTGKQIPLAWMTDHFKNDLDYFLKNLPNSKNVRYKPVMEGAFVFERETILLPPFEKGILEPWRTSGICVGLGVKGAIFVD